MIPTKRDCESPDFGNIPHIPHPSLTPSESDKHLPGDRYEGCERCFLVFKNLYPCKNVAKH